MHVITETERLSSWRHFVTVCTKISSISVSAKVATLNTTNSHKRLNVVAYIVIYNQVIGATFGVKSLLLSESFHIWYANGTFNLVTIRGASILVSYYSCQINVNLLGDWLLADEIYCPRHDDVIKWKHFRVTDPLCGEFTGPGAFPIQRPVTRSFDIFFDLRLSERLSKQSSGWWFETPPRPLWRHCNM